LSNNHTRPVCLALLVFALLAIAHTWPLAAAPTHWSRADPGDGALNIWAVGWVGRMLVQHPGALFNANIFYPEQLTLAYSEAMLVQGAIAAPVMAWSGSAVLAYNVALVSGFALTGWAFCLLAQRWTSSWSAGYVAGSLAAFNAYSLAQLTHLQFQHVEFFALMLYGLDRLVMTRRLRHAWQLGLAFALQGLSSIYLLVFSIWTLTFATLARVQEWRADGVLGMIGRVAAAAALALVLLAPYLRPYLAVHQMMGFARGVADEQAAAPENYLATSSRLHFNRWSHNFTPEATSNTFPGFAAVALLIVAWSDRRNSADPRFRMCAIAAAGCAAVSFAPLAPFYSRLHATVPLFQAVRVPAHLGQVVLLMIAIMAGFGVATVQQSWRHTRSWPLAAAALVIVVNGEAMRAPIGYFWFDRVPAIYKVLDAEPNAVIVEVPFPMPSQWFLNGPYMVNSTGHWRPMLNGYSGFRPASYEKSYETMRAFPSDAALLALHELGVTDVVVHGHDYGDDRVKALAALPSLRAVAHDGDITIFRLVNP